MAEVIQSANERLLLVSPFLRPDADKLLVNVLTQLERSPSSRAELTFISAATRAEMLEQDRLMESLRLQAEYGKRLTVSRIQAAFDGLIALSDSELFISGRQWRAFAQGTQVGVDRGGGRRVAGTPSVTEPAEATLRRLLRQTGLGL